MRLGTSSSACQLQHFRSRISVQPITLLPARPAHVLEGLGAIARQTSRRLPRHPLQGSATWASSMHANYLELEEYEPPAWAKHLGLVPKQRYRLGMLPTPVHRWHLPGLPPDVEVWIKRDDVTGMQLSGNKVRKLEFLMAEAKQQGHDCVITIGGIQSNHCRATAVAARYLGLQCHLLLRVSRMEVDQDPGLVGNLLVDRLSGAVIHKVTKEEYVSRGSVALCLQLEAQLRAAGHHPYVIPVGGSSPLGTWGYLEGVEEVRQQQQGLRSRQQPGSTLAGSTAASDGDQSGFFTDIAMVSEDILMCHMRVNQAGSHAHKAA